MVDLDIIKHHPAIEDITDVLCNRTQNQDRDKTTYKKIV